MKTTKQQTSPVSEAVRSLRLALGESQQAFAYRLKTAIRTIARYETIRPPKGKALSEFFRVATEIGNQDLAAVFRDALTAEMPAIFGVVAAGNANSRRHRSSSTKEHLMRLPRTPFMFFRFANKPAGQILIHTGRGRGARANMAKHVAAVDDLCYVLMDASSKMAYATRAGAPPPTPKDGNLAILFDGERYTRWTCMTDREIIRISRYATGCIGGPQ